MAAAPSIGRATGVEAPAAPPGSLAVHTLYERHADRVLAYCAYRLRDRNEADDALQTTFMHALRALQRGVVPEIELAWLLSIARNVCLTHWDINRRRGRLEVARDPHVLQEVAPCRESEGEELFRLQEALEAMPERERRAILLREWQGLSYREIAAELDLSQSAVETLIFRARRVLANGLRGVPAPGKRRAALGLDLSSLLGALKSLLGGAAVKVAVGAAVVAATVSAGPLELQAERPAKPPAFPAQTLRAAPSPEQDVLHPARPLPVRPDVRIEEDAQPENLEQPAEGATPGADDSGFLPTHSSGASGQVPSVLSSPATELAGDAPSLEDAVAPAVDQVASAAEQATTGVGQVVPTVLPLVEASATVLDAGQQVLAPLSLPSVVALP
jgi:RNA polymerase sigma factor (sigma-70 family)